MTNLSSSYSPPITTVCLGTGRFLRSVLVPALLETDECNNIVLIQPRGRSFVDYCHSRADEERCMSYEVDTVEYNGKITTANIGPIRGVMSLGSNDGREALLKIIQNRAMSIRMIGVGVTEAGLASSKTSAIRDLTWILCEIYQRRQSLSSYEEIPKLCVLNTDNVPYNGNVIQSLVLQVIDECHSDTQGFRDWCSREVVFLNTMVDRITSQREGSGGIVPFTEPCPAKALVIE